MKREANRTPKIWLWVVIVIIVVTLILIFSKPIFSEQLTQNIALIYINGLVLAEESDSIFPYSTTYSSDIIDQIENVMKNKNIKAIIFEINSPGGSAVASSEIAEAIKKAKKEKLTVAVIREQGTSGAYWIASACDHVISHPLSITGSIGVLASYLEISGLLERFNITYVNLTAGKYKDIMSPYRELTEEEKEMIQNKLNIIHKTFIKEISENRKLDEDKTKELANGMFYLGSEAKELGLVDALGTREDAINYIEQKLNIKANIKEYKKETSLLDIFSKIQAQNFFWLGRGIGASLVDKNLLIDLNSITPRT
ncbi:MAG: signal peptide peptidase SppA [Candidatus Pacearchaeota archaeon]|nr:signal peptide peptidase SppA [Candidatus Pacearchaeota archaeon]